MDTKHTPGPWHVAGQEQVQIRSEKHQIAKAWSFAGKTGQANARLIAAAPLLLDALQRVVAMWDHHADAHGDGVASPLHEAARAAISAATN